MTQADPFSHSIPILQSKPSNPIPSKYGHWMTQAPSTDFVDSFEEREKQKGIDADENIYSLSERFTDAPLISSNDEPRGGKKASRLYPSSRASTLHSVNVPVQNSKYRLVAYLQTSTGWLQIIMFLAFLVALALAMTQKYNQLSSGVIWGAVLSGLSVCFVIFSYVRVPAYRQHPNPLIFWRTVADAMFVTQLAAQPYMQCLFYGCNALCSQETWRCGCSEVIHAGRTCDIFAGFFEFSLISAECWFLCMTINLYVSLTNPFTDFKQNTRFFHIFCWGAGIAMGVTLATTGDWAGYSDLGVCWTNALRKLPPEDPDSCPLHANVIDNFSKDYKAVNANLISWAFFYVWMAIIIILGIAVWVWASNRLSEGMSETYAVRVQSINRARFIVFAVTFYWIISAIVYIKFLTHKVIHRDRITRELLNFLIAGRGYVDLVIWYALNDFNFSDFSDWSGKACTAEVDLSPKVNAALRKEVLLYTTSGIIQAVQTANGLDPACHSQRLALLTRSSFSVGIEQQGHNHIRASISNGECFLPEGAEKNAANNQSFKTFHDYEPHAFKRIRQRFQVTNKLYLQSLSSTAKERLSEGASGAFMFFSADGALIVKSMSKQECAFLRQIAQKYADYLCNHPDSLLTRFYGCHCLELYSKKFYFVVMANLFDTDQVIHYRYDIKGSWVNRNADLPKKGKRVTCRHCNRKYTYMSTANLDEATCPERLNGHEPNVVLKDPDLTQKLKLDNNVAVNLYRQLCADSDLLCSFGIMDYSLLMGVHEDEYIVGDDLQSDRASSGKAMPGKTNKNCASVSRDPKSGCAHTSQQKKVRPQTERSLVFERPALSSSGRRLPRNGMRLANTVVGPSYYYLGIIDILQTWTVHKQTERLLKIVCKRVDGDGLSALEPDLYKLRFQSKMADILGIEDKDEAKVKLFKQQSLHMDTTPQSNTHAFSSVRSFRSFNTNDDNEAELKVDEETSKDSNNVSTDKSAMHLDAINNAGQPTRASSGIFTQQARFNDRMSVDHEIEEYAGIDYHL